MSWLPSLPLMRTSFWWWQCSVRYELPLPSYLLDFWSPPLLQKWHRTLNWFNNGYIFHDKPFSLKPSSVSHLLHTGCNYRCNHSSDVSTPAELHALWFICHANWFKMVSVKLSATKINKRWEVTALEQWTSHIEQVHNNIDPSCLQ